LEASVVKIPWRRRRRDAAGRRARIRPRIGGQARGKQHIGTGKQEARNDNII
jgi:hypothetical protein